MWILGSVESNVPPRNTPPGMDVNPSPPWRRMCATAPGISILALLWIVALPVPAAPQATPLDARRQAVHVLNRLAFGPSPGDVDRVVKMGWRSWIEEQLDPASIEDSAMDRRLEAFPSLRLSMAQTYRGYRPPKDLAPDSPKEQRDLELEKQRLRRNLQAELDESVLLRAVESKRRFQEVIVDFWRNHLNVSCDKAPYWANHYEENVLRKHAFGRWEDLLLASAKHPAMLVYLDNHLSKKGNINENYAREVMELHTLGVDNYYTQRDVEDLTRVLTGWTCFWRYDKDGTEHWRFVFRENHHDTEPATVLGLRLDGAGGVADGERALRYLARHEGTSRFLSQKLCRHLVADDPPEALVAHVAAVFRATDGNLPAVYRAIVLSPEFMDPACYGAKLKTPFEFVVSALRATATRIESGRPALQALETMGQPVFKCDIPTGYSDQAEAWLDPGALVHRWEFARRLADGKLKGLAVPDALPCGVAKLSPEEASHKVLEAVLPGGSPSSLEQQLTGSIDVRHMVALALASPEFQQQ